jgi:nucleotide-binding universal stress UspA family protein
MKPIVLATDGSPSAAEATLQAIELARALNAPIVAVAVEQVAVPSYGYYYGYPDLITEMTKVEKAHVDETLAQATAAATEAGVPCEAVHATGSAAEEICIAAENRDAQMIVIGAHGWGSFRRLWHGSVSMTVLHEAHCPVLVVQGGLERPLEPSVAREEAFSR